MNSSILVKNILKEEESSKTSLNDLETVTFGKRRRTSSSVSKYLRHRIQSLKSNIFAIPFCCFPSEYDDDGSSDSDASEIMIKKKNHMINLEDKAVTNSATKKDRHEAIVIELSDTESNKNSVVNEENHI